ncbi:hypothetical protein PVK06_031004 [Gossypium arboreum]|uniref:Uncharacterized protein n=1 Tax=Gossypium arboreum TaxID=29729 RepID=A0ABR0NQE6_GOSAR|nr:hypothetical protein PVK06_031004 [Gossypium arboreum]
MIGSGIAFLSAMKMNGIFLEHFHWFPLLYIVILGYIIQTWRKMEGSKMAMVLVAYITVLVFSTGVAATGVREDQGAVAPSPMESAGVALGASAVFVAVVSMLAWFL